MNKLKEGSAFIKSGWHNCCVSLFNVYDLAQRVLVLEEVAKEELDRAFVPAETEGDCDYSSSSSDEDDDKKDELDIMKERQFGTRRGTRARAAAKKFDFQLNSQHIALSEDSS